MFRRQFLWRCFPTENNELLKIKPNIDEINEVLVVHYGFPEEEQDFSFYNAIDKNGSPKPHFETDTDRNYFLATFGKHPLSQVLSQDEAQDELNNFLENITETVADDMKMDLFEIISAGENNLVEFKTTLRYDMNMGGVNKKLEHAILKTIAAFSNAQGGTLIMGVSDDMEIIGLDHDFQTLKNGTKDEFELHLRNLTNKAYGVDFSSNNIDVSFPIVEDNEICVIEIKPWYRPLYTELTDNNGVKSVKFFLRNGNSSRPLPTSEIAGYINTRFS